MKVCDHRNGEYVLVALDGIVELLEQALNPVTPIYKYQDPANAARLAVCRAVLAALNEGGTT